VTAVDCAIVGLNAKISLLQGVWKTLNSSPISQKSKSCFVLSQLMASKSVSEPLYYHLCVHILIIHAFLASSIAISVPDLQYDQ